MTTPDNTHEALSNAPTTVFYDGGCPLCAREIAFYQRRKGAQNIDWINLADVPDDVLLPGLTRQAALGRFHVRDNRGRLYAGGAAFAVLWQSVPGFRVLGYLFRLPGFSHLLELAYMIFLPLRPSMQRWFGQADCCLAERGADPDGAKLR